MKKKLIATLLCLMLTSMIFTGCDNCIAPSNPFQEIQYALEAGDVDGIFIHSTEWLNIVNNDAFDTFRIATRVILFDQPRGEPLNTGAVSVNGRSLSLSNDGVFSMNLPKGNLGALNGPITWQISGVNGHDDFTQEFALRESSFFNLEQPFTEIRTNSEFFITIDRGINGDDAYTFFCGSEGCITTRVDVGSPQDHYNISEFEITGTGNGLRQGTNRLIEQVTIGAKTYAIIFQTSAAYHTEIIKGNEPKCKD